MASALCRSLEILYLNMNSSEHYLMGFCSSSVLLLSWLWMHPQAAPAQPRTAEVHLKLGTGSRRVDVRMCPEDVTVSTEATSFQLRMFSQGSCKLSSLISSFSSIYSPLAPSISRLLLLNTTGILPDVDCNFN